MLIKTSHSLKRWILWRFLLTLVDFDFKKPFHFLKPYFLANMCIIMFSCSAARLTPCIYQENLSIFQVNSNPESFANFLQIVLVISCNVLLLGESERLQTTYRFVYHCRNLQPTYAFIYHCSSTRSFSFHMTALPHEEPLLSLGQRLLPPALQNGIVAKGQTEWYPVQSSSHPPARRQIWAVQLAHGRKPCWGAPPTRNRLCEKGLVQVFLSRKAMRPRNLSLGESMGLDTQTSKLGWF